MRFRCRGATAIRADSEAGAPQDFVFSHRGERQARAGLVALVETSPGGVVVFDATSGRLVSFNREARRIVLFR